MFVFLSCYNSTIIDFFLKTNYLPRLSNIIIMLFHATLCEGFKYVAFLHASYALVYSFCSKNCKIAKKNW